MHFCILIYDEPDTAHLRDEWRARHLDYLKAFDAQTLFAGPFVDDAETVDLGSLRLIEFADRAAAGQHVADEPYVIGGLQKRWRIHRWEPHVPYTWRDCPRTEGNIQVMVVALDGPDGATMRAQVQPENRAYVEAHAQNFMVRGPLLSDDGAQQIGSAFLLDVPDMAAARQLYEEMPFASEGVFADVVFHRWRFGRVFDRFKV